MSQGLRAGLHSASHAVARLQLTQHANSAPDLLATHATRSPPNPAQTFPANPAPASATQTPTSPKPASLSIPTSMDDVGIPRLIEDLRSLLHLAQEHTNEGHAHMGDVVFLAGPQEERVYAHRSILCVRCPLLAPLLMQSQTSQTPQQSPNQQKQALPPYVHTRGPLITRTHRSTSASSMNQEQSSITAESLASPSSLLALPVAMFAVPEIPPVAMRALMRYIYTSEAPLDRNTWSHATRLAARWGCVSFIAWLRKNVIPALPLAALLDLLSSCYAFAQADALTPLDPPENRKDSVHVRSFAPIDPAVYDELWADLIQSFARFKSEDVLAHPALVPLDATFLTRIIPVLKPTPTRQSVSTFAQKWASFHHVPLSSAPFLLAENVETTRPASISTSLYLTAMGIGSGAAASSQAHSNQSSANDSLDPAHLRKRFSNIHSMLDLMSPSKKDREKWVALIQQLPKDKSKGVRSSVYLDYSSIRQLQSQLNETIQRSEGSVELDSTELVAGAGNDGTDNEVTQEDVLLICRLFSNLLAQAAMIASNGDVEQLDGSFKLCVLKIMEFQSTVRRIMACNIAQEEAIDRIIESGDKLIENGMIDFAMAAESLTRDLGQIKKHHELREKYQFVKQGLFALYESVGNLQQKIFSFRQLSSASTQMDIYLQKANLTELFSKSLIHSRLVRSIKQLSGVFHLLAEAISQGHLISNAEKLKRTLATSEDMLVDSGYKICLLTPREYQLELMETLNATKGFCTRLRCVVEKLQAPDQTNVSLLELSVICKSVANIIQKMIKIIKSSSSKDTGGNASEANDESKENISIWSEPPEPYGIQLADPNVDNPHKRIIKAASLNKLVEHATSIDRIDQEYVKTILMTYKSFTDTKTLFSKLMERYNVPSVSGSESSTEWSQFVFQIQTRVVKFLKDWVQYQHDDLQDYEPFLQFLRGPLTEKYESLAKQIDALFSKKVEEDMIRFQANMSRSQKALLGQSGHSMDVADKWSEEELAIELTFVEFDSYSSIKFSELLNQSWNKPALKDRSPNVLFMTSRFNQLSLWVATSILCHEKIKHRAKTIARFVRVAEWLRKLNNFQSLFSVIAGLSLSSIHRLTHSWNEAGEAVTSSYKSLSEIVSMSQSYKVYRQAYASVEPPSIPFIGVSLQDLTFIEDGNPDLVDGLINFRKREMVYQAITKLLSTQGWSYKTFMNRESSGLLRYLPHEDEAKLYDISLMLEPRGADRIDLS